MPRAREPRPQSPMPVTVAEDPFHRPLFVMYPGQELKVESVDQQWQDAGEPWERKPASKLYYQVALENGARLTLFKNMEHDGWYRLLLARFAAKVCSGESVRLSALGVGIQRLEATE